MMINIDQTVGLTASDFNLYASKSGVQVAVDALNLAFLDAACMVMENRMKKDEAYHEVIQPVIEKHAQFGACDSDARDVIRHLYTDVMKKYG